MADIPLTEKRFFELLDATLDQKLEEKLEEKLDKILDKKFEEKLRPINKMLKELKGFQTHESDAIEFELQEVLESYLVAEYPLMKVERFRMKKISDPKTGKDITDFDAAFLVQNINYQPDYSRVKEAALPIPKTKADYTDTVFFAVAEAKHHIDKDKIKEKLEQFDKIRAIFNRMKQISQIPENERKPELLGVSSKFLNTILHHKYLARIDQLSLFFGAAHWPEGLLKDIKGAVSIYRHLVQRFNTAQPEQKPNFYKQLCSLESKWYEPGKAPNSPLLSPEQIVNLNTIDGAMLYVGFIEPSGERYKVVTKKEKEPFGITSIPLQGGGGNSKKKKTRRRHGLIIHKASAHSS
jgi:hypothetical protein